MRTVVSGHFAVALPASQAIGLFTPEGERQWVPEWNPIYAAGHESEDAGTVFTTEMGDAITIWLILEIDRITCTSGYSRVTPGHHAGTVRVRCTDTDTGVCAVSVTYDMTLLPGSDPHGLDSYSEDPFDAMMREWASAITSLQLHPDEPDRF